MTTPALDPQILHFYSERYAEGQRLTRTPHGQLEFLRTQELLRRELPNPPARLLDVGGGPGVHAQWLTADGHAVTLVDPVPLHVEQAAALGGFSASVGDARALAHDDDSFQSTLLLGPLYHLVEAADRATALREAARVTQPGGMVAVAAISRHAGILDMTADGSLDDAAVCRWAALLGTGRHHDDPHGFTNAYFHHSDELVDEMRTAGLKKVRVYGVEGPAWTLLDHVPVERVADLLPAALRAARLLESDERIVAASAHFLAFGEA